ncbi:MAG: threonine synthase [Chloroflexi bacterium]|nr:threonine synthase [Chloroflexota bacterium]MBT4943722.1 threonine synthase [Chloroflexota bacterium]MBT5253659.1 threonine synthase [Chloroflexota bacterium]MBT5475819.1 threonine synthase [Chloroflexota bacterium]MBT5892836.1 threonine synthase [Chloroflexota bacterium]
MTNVQSLRCKECGRDYPLEPIYVCDFCFGPLEVSYDYDAIAKNISRESIQDGPLTIWRYDELLPASRDNAVNIGAGMTPLLKADNLGKELGLNNLWIKNDAANPTHSFKDRVVSVAATKAVEFDFDTIACASTGNLAGATAAHGAKAGMNTMVFIPSDLERGKILGAAIFGSVVLVNGNYDDVNRLCSELGDDRRWAFVNINMRPYYSEGSKSIGYELAEQLGWHAPKHVVVPVASGSLFTKVYKGLQEFAQLGLIDSPETKMHIAQPFGCSPVAKAFIEGKAHPKPVVPDTIAKSLAIGSPADGMYSVGIANKTGGSGTIVPESEIAEGMKLLAETEGIFTETAGGVVISTLRRLAREGVIAPDEETVVLITGTGLKTLEAIADSVETVTIDPTIRSFDEVVTGAPVS